MVRLWAMDVFHDFHAFMVLGTLGIQSLAYEQQVLMDDHSNVLKAGTVLKSTSPREFYLLII